MNAALCRLHADLHDDPSAEARQRLARHLEICASCRAEHAAWSELDRLAAGLRASHGGPDSWEGIEAALATEARRPAPLRRMLVPAAAVVLLALVLLRPTGDAAPGAGPRALLAADERGMIAREQRDLEAELRRLEPRYRQRAAAGGPEAALVAGQLAYLDENLRRTRTLLASNRHNAGLQRALIGCARRRVQILKQFVND